MFGFIRDRRVRTVIQQVSGDLDANLRRLSPVERSATFALTNVYLMFSAEIWGREILFSPLSLAKKQLSEMVLELAESHAKIVTERLPTIAKRNETDPYVLQATRQLRAMELAIATVGNTVEASAQDAAIAGWKLLWTARANSEAAGWSLRDFEVMAKVSAVPKLRKRALRPEDYAKLARTLPPFLQPKRPKARQPQQMRRSA